MKFSIRDLLLVTVIVALTVGWWVEHRQNIVLKQENEALQMGNDFISGNFDKIMHELDMKRLQLGEPIAQVIEGDPSDEIRTRQLGSPPQTLPHPPQIRPSRDP